MKLRRNLHFRKQRGFTLLEMLLSLLIMVIVIGAVFSQMDTAQKRMNAEQTKLDDFQQARDFVDQFFRDINQIGDPNIRLFDQAAIVPAFQSPLAPPYQSPRFNDNRVAVGLVRVDTTSIAFEGSVNGIGTVQSVQYMINGSGTCALCLQRSQVDKANNVSPWQQGTNWGTEINDVVSNPIFSYFDVSGNLIGGLPVDISTPAGAQTIANIKTIQISMRIQNPAVVDMQTGQPIESVFEGKVSLNNCSMATTGQPMSCQ
ncbi:MAG TPA: prepilin-type N-terminal cleavage/methylation domain-containing protein [Candidatus Dormibacteraeota bacterium]|nr:prepilin-type N-terminal cleavage/methylation domain-containing protein [Candidatus Dormibacteraeota bacterium]